MYQNGKANILEASSQQRRYLRNHLMGMVYQNPMLGLRMNISSGANIAEKLIDGYKRQPPTPCWAATPRRTRKRPWSSSG